MGTLNEFTSVRSICPHLRNRWIRAVHGHQNHPATLAVLDIGRKHKDGEDEAKHVDEEMPLSALDLFAGIISAWSTHLRCFRRLAVDNCCRRLRIAPRSLSCSAAKGIVNPLPGSVLPPLVKIAVDRVPWW